MDTAVLVEAKVQEFETFLASLPPAGTEADNIDRIQCMERAKRALSAVQAKATHRFVEQRQAQETANNIPTSMQIKGIEAEVGLARGESPFVGAGLTHTATALCTVLPHTLAALEAGEVSEYHARIVAEQTNHLSDAHRRAIDAAIATKLGHASSSRLRSLIQGHAYRLDREAADQRAADNQRRRRRVCLDPAGEGMVYVTAELPTHQGVAVMDALTKTTNQRLAAVRKTNDTNGEQLSRDQVMADAFVELLTGQTTAKAVTAEVVVIINDTTLFGDDDLPGWILGQGPLPAGMTKDWLANPQASKFIRRMYTRAADGQLVALDAVRRRFPAVLSKMLRIRDDTCATPWCNSPVQDIDHRHPWAKGGTTSWANGLGLCKRCNQRKENRGWAYTGTPDHLTVITPTGHQYTVPTKPPITEIGRWNTDPPALEHTTVDIACPTAA
ncbi:HNH endonuclease signature motif containing protein [Yaniella flava]|uniref:HNH endonuclease signature motif containing protein n=1 Tax=Yaniella flava TaxID=287930 RepID=A0ABN2URW3_9MICC